MRVALVKTEALVLTLSTATIVCVLVVTPEVTVKVGHTLNFKNLLHGFDMGFL